MTIWQLLDERHLELRLHRTPAILGEQALWYCILNDPTENGVAIGICNSETDPDIVVPCGCGKTVVEAINNFIDLIKGRVLAIQDVEEDAVEFVRVPTDLTA